MHRPVALFAVIVLCGPALAADPKPVVEFRLSFDPAALNQPFTGRVFVLLTKTEPRRLPNGINWFNPASKLKGNTASVLSACVMPRYSATISAPAITLR